MQRQARQDEAALDRAPDFRVGEDAVGGHGSLQQGGPLGHDRRRLSSRCAPALDARTRLRHEIGAPI
jgi:hypothetical protein